jgi:hypothetical protein
MRFAVVAFIASLATPAFAANVVILDDHLGAPWSGVAAGKLGHTATVFFADGAGFAAACATADLCIVESAAWTVAPVVGVAIDDALARGTPVIVQYAAFEVDPLFNAALEIAPVDYRTPFPAHTPAGLHDFFFRIPTGALVWPGVYDAGVNGARFRLTGGGWLGSAEATIAVTRNELGIANGFLAFDYQDADADTDGVLDVVELFEEEIHWLLGGKSPPNLSVDGTPCPRAVTLRANGFTAGGRVAVASANNGGSSSLPSGVCAGTALGLGSVSLRLSAVLTASASGRVDYTGPVSPGLCGKVLQMIDLSSCAVSNVEGF